MKIKELKEKIENKEQIEDLIIFKYTDNYFIPLQYINEISRLNNKEIDLIENINAVITVNIFDNSVNDNISLYIEENEFNPTVNLINQKNLIIITKKINKEISKKYNEFIIEVPKLEKWQITEYVYSRGMGVPQKDLDKLLEVSNYDIFRLKNELDKIEIFDEKIRPHVFKEFVENGIFSDLTNFTVFNFTDGFVKRNKNIIKNIYPNLINMDVNSMGVLSILYSNFRNIIKIQLSPNPTPENTGLKSNQFWAIKKNNTNYFNKQELLKIYNVLLEVDKHIKTGYLTTDQIIDYLIIKILGVSV